LSRQKNTFMFDYLRMFKEAAISVLTVMMRCTRQGCDAAREGAGQ